MAKLNNTEIEAQALKFRIQNHYNEFNPINCKKLLFKLNILTLYRPLSADFSGMCIKSGDKKFILINSNHSRGRQHFTIMHEIYHLFIQEDFSQKICSVGAGGGDIHEQRADSFASHFLMPRSGVINMIPEDELKKNISLLTILKLEKYFGVSHSACLNRLLFLELITRKRYEEFKTLQIKSEASKYGFDLDIYEKGNGGLVIGDYGIKAKTLFDDERISETHYSNLLKLIGIDITENHDEEAEN